jgi:hypothetical protein
VLGADAPPFEVISDASGFGLGACLMQDGHPVAYESRTMSPAERNYTTSEQELLAVVHAMKIWRPYLEGGGKVTVITDHQPNTYLPTQPLLSRRKMRWQEFLSRFDIEWMYKPGRTNMADPLSRCPSLLVLGAVLTRAADGYVNADIDAEQSVLVQALQDAYATDPWFDNPENVAELRYKGGLYFYDTNRVAVAADPELKLRLLKESHDPPHSGHFGTLKTFKSLERDYWWPGMRADVENYVSTCSKCQRNKSSTQRPAGLLQPLGVPDYRWQEVTLDFIVQLPKTKKGHDAIVVFVDRLSKMVHFAACRSDVTAEQTASLYYDHVFKLHGLSEKLVSDRGTQFTSRFWKELMSKLGTEVALSSAWHPSTDGQSERTNRTLEQYLRQYVSAAQDDWDEFLASAEFAMNNQWQESVRETPFMLNFGQHPRVPLTVPGPFKVPVAQHWHGRMHDTLKLAKAALLAAQNHQAAYTQNKRRDVSYDVGDYVLLNSKNIKLRMPPSGSRKMMPRSIGPFKIIQKVGAVAYKLELPENMKRVHPVFHVSLLRKWNVPRRSQPPPPTIEIEGETLWLFDRILDHRGHKRNREYLVKWKDFGHEHNSWEPAKSFEHCRAELLKYWQSVNEGPSPSIESSNQLNQIIDQERLEQEAQPRSKRNGAGRRKKRKLS